MPQDLILLVVSIVGVTGLVGLVAFLFGTQDQVLGQEEGVRTRLREVASDFEPEDILIGDRGRAALALNKRNELALIKTMGDKTMVRTIPLLPANITSKPIANGTQFIIRMGDIGLGAFKLKTADKDAAEKWVEILGGNTRDSEAAARTNTA